VVGIGGFKYSFHNDLLKPPIIHIEMHKGWSSLLMVEAKRT
jgi:hypothetical protein